MNRMLPIVLVFSLAPVAMWADDEAQVSELKAVPVWASEAVWYQIVPTRFRNGDPSNDPTVRSLEFPVRPSNRWKIQPWTGDWYARAPWEKELGDDFYEDGVLERRYGGDLAGVIEKLDYLKGLGINAISFSPVFDSHSSQRSDCDSYHHIDPHLGPDPAGDRALIDQETDDPSTWKWSAADKLFLDLIRRAHDRKIRVVISGVFDHTGRDFFAFRDLRREQAASAYRDWYVVERFDDPATPRNEFRYHGWWGHETLPEFAKTKDGKDLHPGPKKYIFDSTRRWMDPDGDGDPSDGIDGWCLRQPEELPMDFWNAWNALIRSVNPAALTVCDVRQDPAKLIAGGQFSAALNYYGFALPVKGFFIDGKLSAAQLGEMLNRRRAELPGRVAFAMQNLVDSDDTDRLASMILNPSAEDYLPDKVPFDTRNSPRASATYNISRPDARARSIQRMIGLFQMTYIGAPMIYYGTEAGMWGADDPDDRMPMVWQDLKFEPQATDPRGTPRAADDVNFNEVMYAFYKQVIALRRDYKALNKGDFAVVETGAGDRAFAFRRDFEEQHVLVVFNRSEEPAIIPLKLGEEQARFATPAMIFTTSESPGAVVLEPASKSLTVRMPPLTAVVIGGK